MPAFHVEKSTVVNSPIEDVYACVRDFRKWCDWSPWLTAEPDCKLVYAEDGTSYTWDGKVVGSGELAITNEDAPRKIDYRLSFFRPWKSVNKSQFRFAEQEGGTEVTWTMEGTLPFFLFFLKGMMTTAVGMDYRRGLAMLKELMETGSVPSKLEFEGVKTCEAMSFLGIRRGCAIAEIGQVMGETIGRVHGALTEAGVKAAGPPLSVYHRWNMKAARTEFTAGFPVKEVPADLPAGLVAEEVPAGRVYSVKHTGPYRHLGNAWSAGMMHGQARVFRKDKKFHPFEVYVSDPREVAESDLVTVVNLGAK